MMIPAGLSNSQGLGGMATKSGRVTRYVLPLLIVPLVAVLWSMISCGGGATTTTTLAPTTTGATQTTNAAAPGTTAPSATTTTTTEAATAWKELKPPGPVPMAREYASMVYDPEGRKVILFGGYGSLAVGSGMLLNDTWTYDPAANSWTSLSPTINGVLAMRTGQAMAYDSTGHRVIMFGGVPNSGGYLNDTWAYDPKANTWTELKPKGPAPSGRRFSAMVFDPKIGKVILFGGSVGMSLTDFVNDTWAYDPGANTWTKLKPKGALPSPRSGHAMVFDPMIGKVILFGGILGSGETWAYDSKANTWTDLEPTGEAPEGSYEFAMACDSVSGKVIVSGGDAVSLNDTWIYDPQTNHWTAFDFFLEGESPPDRKGPAMVYDPVRKRAILFGGSAKQGQGAFNDTWAFYPERALTSTTATTAAAAPAVPQLLAPTNGTVYTTNPPYTMLSWQAVPSAVSYTLEMQFQGPTDSTWQVGVPQHIFETSYAGHFSGAYRVRWRATAVSAEGVSSASSEWWTFVMANSTTSTTAAAPAVPQLLAPANVVDSNPPKTILSWQAVPSAVDYLLETQWEGPTDSTWREGAVLHTAGQTTWMFEFTPDEYRVRWRVAAISAAGVSSAPSGWWTFEYTQ